MSVIKQEYVTEARVIILSLQEIFQVIIEKLDDASDLFKKIVELIYKSKEFGTIRQLILALQEQYSKIDSKKHALDCLLNLALENKENNVQQADSNNQEKHPENHELTYVATEKHLEDHERTNLATEKLLEDHERTYLVTEKQVEDHERIYIADKGSYDFYFRNFGNDDERKETEVGSYLSNDSTVDVFDEIRTNKSKLSDIQKILKNTVYTKDKTGFEKDLSGRTNFLSFRLKNTKLGNLSEEGKRKRLNENESVKHKGKIDILDTDYPVYVNFRLQNGVHPDRTGIYKTHIAIFRNKSASDLLTENVTLNGGSTQNECEVNRTNVQRMNNMTDVVLMPSDIEGNNHALNELRDFLSSSTNNSFSVQIPYDFTLENQGEIQLVVDVEIHQASRKPHKRRFTFRMHVVTSDMFEMASMACQIQTLELTYTNIFPSDCRMFIALPIYRDGYLDRKDRLDRQ